MVKSWNEPRFSLFCRSARWLAWGISGPHISTVENLHTKQEPIFSVYLRAFIQFFGSQAKLCWFFRKIFAVNFFCSQSPLPFIEISKCFFRTHVVCQCFVVGIFSGAVAEQVLWNLLVNLSACSRTFFWRRGWCFCIRCQLFVVSYAAFWQICVFKRLQFWRFCICLLTLHMLRVV